MSNEKQETIADIVKKLRRLSNEERALATRLRKTDDNVDFALASCYAEDAKYLSQIADCIEAARKREKAEIEADVLAVGGIVEAERHRPGNAAAMREACAKMRDLLMLRGDGKAYCVLSWDEFNESQKMLRAALSAPRRNCDLYNDGFDAEDAYEKDTGVVINDDPADYYPDYNRWLFAPAERKGEGK